MKIPPILSLGALLSACASGPTEPSWPKVPEALRPDALEKPVMALSARGVQIYECRNSASGAAWAFIAPEADLFDAKGRRAGRHYAGPRWESEDGSIVEGAVKARVNAAHAEAIPWLLLSAKSVGGVGVFSRVSSIQRVATEGGAMPADGCSPTSLGQIARVPYTATYVMFSRSP